MPASLQWLFIAMCVVATAVWFAYEVPASANSGQTLGKRLLHIKVMRIDSAENLGFGRSLRRWGRLGLPTLLWSCCGAGFVLQFIDCLFVAIDQPLHQALHDKAAATVVVQVSRPDHGQESPPQGQESPAQGQESPSDNPPSEGNHADPR
jgi:uncharacterized RDD family membrane protein YckC